MSSLIAIFQKLGPEILTRTYEHIYLVFMAMVIAVVIALSLGIYLTRCRWPKLVSVIMGIAGAIQTVPSLALIAFRISTVWTIGVATLCGLIGAGGLGDLIIKGLRSIRPDYLLAGTLPAAALALVFDWLLGLVEKWLTPEGLRVGPDNKA